MTDVEVAPWLKGLPVAPEYHPTEAEFADPISYILKIEEEAWQYGICKIVPPVPKASRKTVLSNLNRALAEAAQQVGATGLDSKPASKSKFTTRRQQLGSESKPNGGQARARRLVWQSGESYTVEQFETKAKASARARLGTLKEVCPPSLETLFWKAVEDEPISVEHAAGIPGSAFPEPLSRRKGKQKEGNGGWKLADSSWNMRNVARLQGSLLRFMPNEIQGVTSPMLHISMLFSSSAWHAEDHELHSLNYLHFGAPKTWYAVPSDAASALEDVIRVHGYGGELDPKAAFDLLAEKATVMIPEVLVSTGVPCCRLVQNAGEYVITFPRAYHLGFNHGFNFGEAANFATPSWLKIAKEAAVRRIAMNHLPVLCHEQLLYQSALSFSQRTEVACEVRSSRLKHKKKPSVEEVIKTEFVHDVMKNRQLLDKLIRMGQSKCILLENATNAMNNTGITKGGEKENLRNLVNLGNIDSISLLSFVCESMEERLGNTQFYSSSEDKAAATFTGECNSSSTGCQSPRVDWGTLSCAVCGILCYSCIAIVQPTLEAGRSILAAERDSAAPDVLKPGLRSDLATLTCGEKCQSRNHSSDCGEATTIHSHVDGNDVTRKDVESVACTHSSDATVVTNVQASSVLSLLAATYESDDDSDHLAAKSALSANSMAHDSLQGQGHHGYLKKRNAESGNYNYVAAKEHLMETVCPRGTKWGRINGSTADEEMQSDSLADESRLNEGFSRHARDSSIPDEVAFPCILCPEHALQIHSDLQLCGRSRVLIIYHPDYETFDKSARQIVKDMNIEFVFKDLAFEKGSEDNFSVINAAIDAGVAGKRVNNWAARLQSRIQTLQPSPHSTEYNKTTVVMDEEEGKLTGKQLKEKKCWVVGRWCGRVWRSDQAHSFLGGCRTVPQTRKAIATDGGCVETLKPQEIDCATAEDSPRKRKDSPALKPSLDFARKNCTKRKRTQVRRLEPDHEPACNELESEPSGLEPQQPACHVLAEPEPACNNKLEPETETACSELEPSHNNELEPKPEPAGSELKSELDLTCNELEPESEPAYNEPEPARNELPARNNELEPVCNELEQPPSSDLERDLQPPRNNEVEPEPELAVQSADEDSCHEESTLILPATMHERCPSFCPASKSPATVQDDGQESFPVSCPAPDSTLCQSNSVWHDVPIACSPSFHSQVSYIDRYSKTLPAYPTLAGSRGASCRKGINWKTVWRALSKPEDSVERPAKCTSVGSLAESPPEPERSKARVFRKRRRKDVNIETAEETKQSNCSSETASAAEDDNFEQGSSDEDEASNLELHPNSDVSTSSVQELFTPVDEHPDGESSPTSAPDDESSPVPEKSVTHSRTRKTKRKSWKVLAAVGLEQDTSVAEKPHKQAKGAAAQGLQTRSQTKKSKRSQSTEPTACKNKKRKSMDAEIPGPGEVHSCDFDGCTMSFRTASDLSLHKRNICTVKECGKRLCSHSYLIQHYRVHVDDRPLKCPWKGCKKTFKWSWARTEHLRVHTGERPYTCNECGKSYRFVSDFSRHKRTTGHTS